MLKITLVTPEGRDAGQPPKVYELDHARLSNREAKQVEQYTGMRAIVFQAGVAAFVDQNEDGTFPMVTDAAKYSDADHTTVLVWLALRRNGQPDLRLVDVPEFDIMETEIEQVDDPTDAPAPDAPADPTQTAAPDVAAPVAANPDGVSTG